MNGLILVDKPPAWTSHDVVNRWRKLAGTRRVGHLGTLDPMATGLLALVTGNATRLAEFLNQDDKTYAADITLGVVSNTYDIDGELRQTDAAVPERTEVIEAALNRFRGRFLQTPPPFSAKKIAGVPAYKLARQNVSIELKPVEVEIKRLELEDTEGNRVSIVVSCSAGTYIRSIAHELGQVLGCGALLSKLRRIRIGPFRIEDARTLDQLQELADRGQLDSAILSAATLLPHLPSEHFGAAVETFIRQGRDFRTSPFVVPPGAPFVKALSESGELIAIGELKIPNLYHPRTVL